MWRRLLGLMSPVEGRDGGVATGYTPPTAAWPAGGRGDVWSRGGTPASTGLPLVILNCEFGADGNSGALLCYQSHDAICTIRYHSRLATSILINSGRYDGVQFLATCSSL